MGIRDLVQDMSVSDVGVDINMSEYCSESRSLFDRSWISVFSWTAGGWQFLVHDFVRVCLSVSSVLSVDSSLFSSDSIVGNATYTQYLLSIDFWPFGVKSFIAQQDVSKWQYVVVCHQIGL